MKHRVSEGSRNGCSKLIPDKGDHPGEPPAPEDDALLHRAAEGGEVEFPPEKQVDREETMLPSEANDKELESDDNGEESDKEDGEEEEEKEDEAGEAAFEEQNVVEGDRTKLAEGFFEVEAIRRKRIFKGETQFLIKWRGWPESANTWEPLEHLQLCPDIVEAFEQSLQSGKKTRKRKRKFTQIKKKGQYSNANSGTREHNADAKRSKVGRKACESRPLHDPSQTLGSEETKGDGSSSDKENDARKITIQLEEAAKVDGSPVNSSSKVDRTELSHVDRRTGAKRRKSGSVQRFKPDSSSSNPSHAGNSLPVNGSYDSAEHLMVGNIDPYPGIKFDFSRETSMITRILKPIGYSTSRSNNAEDVLVTFVAMRSDGKEVMVDNKFLKAYYPHVLIDFYEEHLRYSTAS